MFKDSWARGEIRQLWEEMGTASRRQERLSERVAELERHQYSELVEKQCPKCEMATLMRAKYGEGNAFYCYGCGRTFTESTQAVLEEVKEGHGDTEVG